MANAGGIVKIEVKECDDGLGQVCEEEVKDNSRFLS